MSKPLIISVVRDWAMYEKCIAGNPFCANCDKRLVDNSVENETIPRRYNQVLDSLDLSVPRWLVFCHEDFEFLEPADQVAKELSVENIYGPIGVRLEYRCGWLPGGMWPSVVQGEIRESEKNGTSERVVGKVVPTGAVVDTLDCCCLLVHSSLVARHRLRFDENLTFDLYAEDFCAAAKLNCGIDTRIVKFLCHHHSGGCLLPRIGTQKAYLDQKYPKSEMATLSCYAIGGGRTVMRRFQKRVRAFLDRHARPAVDWYFKVIR